MALKEYVIEELDSRITCAEKRYGPFASTHEALGVALEEWNELQDAIRDNNIEHIKNECADLSAVLLRLIQNLNDDNKTKQRSTK